MDTLLDLIRSIPWFAWIPLVAIIGGTAATILRNRQRHIERMAMIKAGMDPNTIRKID